MKLYLPEVDSILICKGQRTYNSKSRISRFIVIEAKLANITCSCRSKACHQNKRFQKSQA